MRAALIQMCSGIDPVANLAFIGDALAQAADGGAAMAFLPEMASLLDRDRDRSARHIAGEGASDLLASLCDAARAAGIWLHSGSSPFLADDDAAGRRVNRSHVIDAAGRVVARYDKRHMFDVDLPTGERWRESASYRPGDAVVAVDTPIGRLGLAICFDLRFPEHFAQARRAGADVIALPAAFTVPTGAAHWHILCRARAIETGCHLIAAAQAGAHQDGRATFGHSLAVDPWGRVLADAGDMVGVSFVDIDPAARDEARQAIPLAHWTRNGA